MSPFCSDCGFWLPPGRASIFRVCESCLEKIYGQKGLPPKPVSRDVLKAECLATYAKFREKYFGRGKISQEIKAFCKERNVPRSTFYFWVNQAGLVGRPLITG